MQEHIYVTHEMLIKTTRIYTLRQFKNCEKDFETINTFNKTNTRNLRVLKHALNDFERIYLAKNSESFVYQRDCLYFNNKFTLEASQQTFLATTKPFTHSLKLDFGWECFEAPKIKSKIWQNK